MRDEENDKDDDDDENHDDDDGEFPLETTVPRFYLSSKAFFSVVVVDVIVDVIVVVADFVIVPVIVAAVQFYGRSLASFVVKKFARHFA